MSDQLELQSRFPFNLIRLGTSIVPVRRSHLYQTRTDRAREQRGLSGYDPLDFAINLKRIPILLGLGLEACCAKSLLVEMGRCR